MAVKYRCTKCDRKFIEWGVAKVKAGKACEDCHGEYLQQVGYDAAQAAPRKKPALKRKRVRVAAEQEVAPTLASFDRDEGVMPDLNTLTSVNGGANLVEVEEFEAPDTVEVEVEAAGAEEEEEGVPVALDEDAATVEDVIALKPGLDEEEEEEDDE
jgi:DNA-directed RNA polymerase subunit RPC12/RpoP